MSLRPLPLVLALAVALAAAGCGATDERDAAEAPTDPAATPAAPQASPDGPVTVRLEDSAGLGLSGEVTLASAGAGRTDVAVDLAGASGAAFSASIRDGSCDAPGAVVHDLGVVEDGASSVSAEAELDELLAQDRALVLTAAEAEGVVACAELPRRAG
jgi:hypothetical protein